MKRLQREESFAGSQPKKHPRLEEEAEYGARESNMETCGRELMEKDCQSYVNVVKERLGNEGFKEYAKIMRDFSDEKIDVPCLTKMVRKLFKGNADLISGFNGYLPEGFWIPLEPEDEVKKKIDVDDALRYVQKIKDRFRGNPSVYKAILKKFKVFNRGSVSICEVYEEVAILLKDEFHLLEELSVFLPLNSDDTDTDNDVPGRRVEENFTASDFYNRERKGAKTAYRCSVTPSFRHDKNSRDLYLLAFCDKVEKKLHNHVQYMKFLKCLLAYSSKIISEKMLKDQVKGLLGSFPGLLDEFDEFLALCEENENLTNDEHSHKCAKFEVGNRACPGNRDETSSDHEGRKRESHPRTDRVVLHRSNDTTNRSCSNSEKEKFEGESIQDLDFSESETCMPSYRLLPQNYPRTSVNCKTELNDEVLNNDFVCCTSGLENFKQPEKSLYEENLFQLEDDRYELDMLIEITEATIDKAKQMMDLIFDGHADGHDVEHPDIPIPQEMQFTASELRCIERLFDDVGLEIVEAIRERVWDVLPIVLGRLEQKKEEWHSFRTECNKVWHKAQAKLHEQIPTKVQDTKSSDDSKK